MPAGQLLTPEQLKARIAKAPGEFEIYTSRSSFEDYTNLFRSMTVPTLIVYGSEDQLVPIQRSRASIEPTLRRTGGPYEFHVFEGVDHDMHTADQHILPEYLEKITTWAKSQLAGAR